MQSFDMSIWLDVAPDNFGDRSMAAWEVGTRDAETEDRVRVRRDGERRISRINQDIIRIELLFVL